MIDNEWPNLTFTDFLWHSVFDMTNLEILHDKHLGGKHGMVFERNIKINRLALNLFSDRDNFKTNVPSCPEAKWKHNSNVFSHGVWVLNIHNRSEFKLGYCIAPFLSEKMEILLFIFMTILLWRN